MSVFGSIMSAIFGKAAHADTLPPGATPSSPTGNAPSTGGTGNPAAPTAAATTSGAAPSMANVDVTAIMDKLADASDEDLDWRKSIVDLMKLLDLDSSLKARKELAAELNYTGNTQDSAAMNVWLHKQVMTKLAENGGKVPAELKHG